MSAHSVKERRGLGRPAEFAVVAIIVTLLVVLVVPAVHQTRNPDGPHGRMIPSATPIESRRVRNAAGLSIVLPENWELKQDGIPGAERMLFIYPRGTPGRRLTALLQIQPLRDVSIADLSRFNAIIFQGSQAYERMVVERQDTFDDPAWSRYTMYFQRGEQWWVVEYGIALECDALPDMIRRYIDTIRWEAESPTKSNT